MSSSWQLTVLTDGFCNYMIKFQIKSISYNDMPKKSFNFSIESRNLCETIISKKNPNEKTASLKFIVPAPKYFFFECELLLAEI